MALIKCPECGKEISDRAVSCPYCGVPIAETFKIKVRIFREKKFIGSANSGPIFVDGNLIGIASSGCEYIIQLSPGQHSISIENSLAQRSNATTIDIPKEATQVDVQIISKSSVGAFISGGEELVVGNVSIHKPMTRDPKAEVKSSSVKLSETWICKKCGTRNTKSTTYCKDCGAYK